jgi:hypothetical protein
MVKCLYTLLDGWSGGWELRGVCFLFVLLCRDDATFAVGGERFGDVCAKWRLMEWSRALVLVAQ